MCHFRTKGQSLARRVGGRERLPGAFTFFSSLGIEQVFVCFHLQGAEGHGPFYTYFRVHFTWFPRNSPLVFLPGATRNKNATSNKKPLGAPGIATRSKDATNGAPGRTTRNKNATRNKCIATSNKCLTSSNKKLPRTRALLLGTRTLGTSASLLVTSALLFVTRSY